MKIAIEITTEEEKALLTQMTSIEEWIYGIVRQRINICIDKIVEDNSDKQARKLAYADKLSIVKAAKIVPLKPL